MATVFSSFSRQDEFEADRLAVKYAKKAGYNEEAMLDVLEIYNDIPTPEDRRKMTVSPGA